jgi:hypothetical protein
MVPNAPASGSGAITPTSVAIGGGSAITSSGPGGALGSNAFTSTAYAPLASPQFTYGTGSNQFIIATSNNAGYTNAFASENSGSFSGATLVDASLVAALTGNSCTTCTVTLSILGLSGSATALITAGAGVAGGLDIATGAGSIVFQPGGSTALSINTSQVVNVASAGSSSAPSLSVGNSTTGLYSVSTTGLGFSVNGTLEWDWGITNTGATTFSNGGIYVSNGSFVSTPTVYPHGNGPLTLTTYNQNGATAGAAVNVVGGNNSQTSGTFGGGSVNITAGSATGTGSTGNGGSITMTLGTSVGGTAGSLTITGLPTATGSYVCSSSGVISVEATACPASDIAQKNPLGRLDISAASARMDLLPASLYTYKDATTYGEGERVGLYAQDVERMDPRCVTYKKDGSVSTYDDRCVIAYLVADRQHMRAEIEDLKRRVP